MPVNVRVFENWHGCLERQLPRPVGFNLSHQIARRARCVRRTAMCTGDTENGCGKAARGEIPRRLAKWLAAEWGNREQAMENPAMWAHIHVVFYPLPWSFLDGYSFYTESAYDYNIGLPYKTSVVRLEEGPDESVELASYKITNADEYWMGAHRPELLEGLSKDELTRMADACNTVYRWDALRNKFKGGSKPGKGCIIRRGGVERETYLDSALELTKTFYSAWDVGRDIATEERVWGPPAGAFEFVVVRPLEDLVPDEPMPDHAEAADVQSKEPRLVVE